MELIVFGAGGGAVELLEEHGKNIKVHTILVEDEPKIGLMNIGHIQYPVMNEKALDESITTSSILLISAVDMGYKKRIAEKYKDYDFFSALSDRAVILSKRIGKGAIVQPLTFIGSTARIGNHVKVNYGAVVTHDCTVGDFSFISTNVSVGARVSIGKCCYIGQGATINPGLTIGDNTTIGANSTVTSDIPANVIAYGSPCKVKEKK